MNAIEDQALWEHRAEEYHNVKKYINDGLIKWIENEMNHHYRIKERMLNVDDVQRYQFHAGYWKALSAVYEQLN